MSETALTQDLDAYKRLLEAQQRKRLKKFDKHSLAWLALVPAWTEQLALECHFPVKEPAVEGATAKEQLRNFVRTAQAKKLCLLKQSTNPERFIWHTAYIFTSLAPYLSVSRQQEALTFVQSIKDTRLQSQSLIKLIPYLAPELLNVALSSAEKIEKPAARAATLLALMPRFEEQRPIILKEAWDAAQEVSDAEEKAQVLLMLLQYYPEDRRTELLQQLFGLLRQEMTEAQQVEIVIGMAPYLPPTLLPSALEFTQTLTQHDEQVQVWLALAEYAPLEERRSILYKARDILVSDLDMEQATRTSLLGIVAQELASEGEFDPALTMTDEISDEETRVHTYIEIVHTLSQHGKFDKAKEQIERLLKTTLRQMDAAWNVTILSSIAQILMQIRENERAKSIAQRAFDGLQSLLPTMSNITIFSSLATVLTQIGEQAQAKQTL